MAIQYYYRAVDKQGNVVDFLLCDKRDEAATCAFFDKAIKHNGQPEKVMIDKKWRECFRSAEYQFSALFFGILIESNRGLLK